MILRTMYKGSLVAVHLLNSLLLAALVQVDSQQQLLPYEPTQYIKTHLQPTSSASPWSQFLESSPQEAGALTQQMKDNLKNHLAKTGTSVVFVKGERVLVQKRSKSLKWDSKIELPLVNTISLMSATLPILLESYKPSILKNPIGEVLRGEHRNSPTVKGYESKSLLNLLNELPASSRPARDDTSLLKGLDTYGKVATFFANTVLEKSAGEAWLDALMALGIPEIEFKPDGGQLLMTLKDFIQYSLTVIHELKILGVVPKSESLPLEDNHYLFGWWINCPVGTKTCLLPNVPGDTIFSLSPSVRLYIVPSLELTMIITGKARSKTIQELLDEDRQIWEQIYSVIAPPEGVMEEELGQSDVADSEHPPSHDERETDENTHKEKDVTSSSKEGDGSGNTSSNNRKEEVESEMKEKEEQSDLVRFIHWIWPPLVFLFWVTLSHVWVYWMLHVCWFVVTRFVKRAHIPRPKTAADVGKN